MLSWCNVGRFLLLCFLLLSQSSFPQQAKFYQSEGTRKMAALLQKIYAELDWQTDPNKDAERAQHFADQLADGRPIREELKLRQARAEALLRAGDSAGAVEELERIRTMCHERGIVLAPFFEKQLRDSLGIAYMRLGEQENCLHYHGQDSCIFPIKGGGVHRDTRGSEGAIREFSAALMADPNDAKARWLLNVAYMTLGRYPQDVPQLWLIPPQRFESEYDIGRFKDVAAASGLIINQHSGGVLMEDFDSDGLLDPIRSIRCGSSTTTATARFRNGHAKRV
jgi:hypothetical protein